MADRGYRTLDPSTFDPEVMAREEFAEHVLVGLSEDPKRLSSRFIYDAVGSELFARITDLEVYYPTACEFEIFRDHGRTILERYVGERLNLVDLGAGDGRKTAVLLQTARDLGLDVRYVPIDISAGAMSTLVQAMWRRFPDLQIGGLVAEFGDGVRWLGQQSGRRNLVLFLGSNIGNFDVPAARGFLRKLWNALNPGDDVLVGFDLKKDIEVLLAAYNDPDGVTAAFDLNLLARINRELGGTFDLSRFRHFATYQVLSGAVESYLVSLQRQDVRVDGVGVTFTFDAWEPIHTAFSYKYVERDIESFARHAGFEELGRFFDRRKWYCDALWRVRR